MQFGLELNYKHKQIIYKCILTGIVQGLPRKPPKMVKRKSSGHKTSETVPDLIHNLPMTNGSLERDGSVAVS